MATIKDIARLANVSIATVSNVINNTSKVKDTTRARVLQAISDLGYDTQISEKEKRSHMAGILGVIFEDIIVFNAPSIYAGICEAAGKVGFNVLACNLGLTDASQTGAFDELDYCEPARRAVNLLLSKDANAIIYVGSQCREVRHISDGYDNGTPFVYAYCYSSDANAISVVYDDEEITYQLITYLIQNGHRDIGVIAGPQNGEHVRLRLRGYQRALFDASILYNLNWVFYGDWNEAFGYHSAEQLMKSGVSAIFCMNDTLAAGAIDYMHDHQINVPEDVSIVGFDNIASSASLYPKLTTVALPLHEIGREAANLAIKTFFTPKAQPENQNVSIPCSIVYRNSVALRRSNGS